MASMNISLPDPMRAYVQRRIDDGQYASVSDYVRDLIRQDQDTVGNETRWLQSLDATIQESLAEMGGDGGIDLDTACDTTLAAIGRTGSALRP